LAIADVLPDALASLPQLLTEVRAPSFEFGRGPVGRLRPDKVVAYFATYDELVLGLSGAGDEVQGSSMSGWVAW
jgi:hypothetical protein